jgi:hypothetical protein
VVLAVDERAQVLRLLALELELEKHGAGAQVIAAVGQPSRLPLQIGDVRFALAHR